MIRYRKYFEHVAKILIGISFLFLIIEALSIVYHLPSISDIIKSSKEYWFTKTEFWSSGLLLHDVEVSLLRCLTGWIIGGIIGVALGLFTGRLFAAALIFEGTFVILKAIPFIALIPLILHIFGISESGKIFLVAWATVGITWIIVHQSALKIPEVALWKAKSLGIRGFPMLYKILFPFCKSEIYAALRNSLGMALIVIAVAELSGVYEQSTGVWWSEGLGYRIFRSNEQGNEGLMMSAILIFSLLGLLLDGVYVLGVKLIGSLNEKVGTINTKRVLSRLIQSTALTRNVHNPSTLHVSALGAKYIDENAIFKDLNFVVDRGKTLMVLGYSGSGKSTLLKCIGHLAEKDLRISGHVMINDTEVFQNGTWLGIVFQENSIFEFLSVWENVTIGSNVKSEKDKLYAFNLLKEFGISHLATKKASALSGGQKQRLAFASAFANKPQILLVDEPFRGLDAITRNKMQEFFINEISGKVTTVFVTHDIEEAIRLGDVIKIGLKSGPEYIIDNSNNMLINKDSENSDRFKLKVLQLLEKTKLDCNHF